MGIPPGRRPDCPYPAMRDVAGRLVAEEFRAGGSSGTKSQAAFRVCEKLRLPLSTLVGVEGFRALLYRALMLARAGAPRLGALQVNRDGTLRFAVRPESPPEPPDTPADGTALIEQLLELLVNFVGVALTLRLVRDVWPNAVLRD